MENDMGVWLFDRGTRKIAYRPLSPELKASSVLEWKRQQPFSLAATKFIEHMKAELEKKESSMP